MALLQYTKAVEKAHATEAVSLWGRANPRSGEYHLAVHLCPNGSMHRICGALHVCEGICVFLGEKYNFEYAADRMRGGLFKRAL